MQTCNTQVRRYKKCGCRCKCIGTESEMVQSAAVRYLPEQCCVPTPNDDVIFDNILHAIRRAVVKVSERQAAQAC